LIGVENVAHSGLICGICAAQIDEHEASIPNSQRLIFIAIDD